jgi:hypothetical protein
VTEQGDADEAELLVCDSSFVGAVAQRRKQPKRVAHWDAVVLDRIDRARNAISVVTLAESRAGYLIADWGPRRVEQDELDSAPGVCCHSTAKSSMSGRA